MTCARLHRYVLEGGGLLSEAAECDRTRRKRWNEAERWRTATGRRRKQRKMMKDDGKRQKWQIRRRFDVQCARSRFRGVGMLGAYHWPHNSQAHHLPHHPINCHITSSYHCYHHSSTYYDLPWSMSHQDVARTAKMWLTTRHVTQPMCNVPKTTWRHWKLSKWMTEGLRARQGSTIREVGGLYKVRPPFLSIFH